jgi:hypothetical protein
MEYSFREMFMLRGAYRYEKAITGDNPSSMYTGWAFGATIQKAFNNGSRLGLDYSYRITQRPANGVHVISLRYSTASKKTKKDMAESGSN